MKRNLLIASILLSGAASAQFTQANEPAVGSTQAMHQLEETADPYASSTGAGQTWDYSSYFGLPDGVTNFSIVDPSTTSAGASFPSATKAVEIQDMMTTYLSSSASSRNSEGFAFSDATLGDITVVFDTDNELLMNYPFALSNSLTDNFSGNVDLSLGSYPCTGNAAASVDGEGTLILNSSTTITGVLRYKLIDTAEATVGFLGEAQMIRTQYEYYKLGTNNNLPLFIHSSLEMVVGGAPNATTFVLSSVVPDGYLNTNENTLTGVTVSPNPATDVLSVKGLKNNATLRLVDVDGKTVLTTTADPGMATLNIDHVNAGVYFLHIVDGEQSGVERVVIR